MTHYKPYSNFSRIRKYIAILILNIFLANVFGCKKFVQVDPPLTSPTSESIFSSDQTAAAVLTGIYARMSTGGDYEGVMGTNGISINTGLSSDEFTLWSNSDLRRTAFYQNNLVNVPDYYTCWNGFYQMLLQVNSAIEGLSKSISLTPSVKSQLTGEAKFIRAFCYFYLVNLFGDVPLVLTSNYATNSSLSRAAKSQIYKQMISDLKEAEILMASNYVKADAISSTSERVRPNKWAAAALLARVYLYNQQWNLAELESTSVIANSAMYSLPSLDQTFLKNSTEAIWQIQPTNTGWNTEDAKVLMLSANPQGISDDKPLYLSNFLMTSFEAGDNRKNIWTESFTDASGTFNFPTKYKSATEGDPVTEYTMVMRLGEQYLIRAEARAKQNNLNGAIADLDQIRNRAGLPLIANTNPGISQASLLDKILHERQVELFTEWGHRWLDLKRTNNIDAVMSMVTPQKGGTWSANWALYPLPVYDIQQNNRLMQNPGY